MAMDIRSIEALINARGLIKISNRNGWAAGTVGIALGYNAQYDTVRVGFIDAEGNYTGEKTTVNRSMVEPSPEGAVGTSVYCGTCGDVFATSESLDAHQLRTGHELDQEDHPLNAAVAETEAPIVSVLNGRKPVWIVQVQGRTMWAAEGVPGTYTSRARAEGVWDAAQRRRTASQDSTAVQRIRSAVNLSW